jgi:hypothetical protein
MLAQLCLEVHDVDSIFLIGNPPFGLQITLRMGHHVSTPTLIADLLAGHPYIRSWDPKRRVLLILL